jgi:hypothetical protein
MQGVQVLVSVYVHALDVIVTTAGGPFFVQLGKGHFLIGQVKGGLVVFGKGGHCISSALMVREILLYLAALVCPSRSNADGIRAAALAG